MDNGLIFPYYRYFVINYGGTDGEKLESPQVDFQAIR
jgi:hypothetical protein